jgi:meiotically up-regulated gene 157 (Mug157) protein
MLEARGVPVRRVTLASRAVDQLLSRATTRLDDGSVYVTTGDIHAMWLRDSTAQVRPLLALAEAAPDVVEIAAGVLRRQVELVLIDPRANAFNAAPTGSAMRHDFRDQSPWVFERKYAIDSLCAPLTLAWLLWRTTGSLAHVDGRFREAARTIVDLWRKEQEHDRSSYMLRRCFARRRASLSHHGRGAPVARTGMTWSGFRPSDDACVYGYHIPGNALAVVSLERLAQLPGDDVLSTEAAQLAAEIRTGITAYGIVELPELGRIYAYEVDGHGRALLLDDANVPSLISLPYLGFCELGDALYQTTRAWALGPGNPLFTAGRAVRGIGSAHTRRGWIWPLAIAIEGLTATDDDERETALRRLEALMTGDGLLHESVDANNPNRFTRRWFSWADMLYVELVLAIAGIRIAS